MVKIHFHRISFSHTLQILYFIIQKALNILQNMLKHLHKPSIFSDFIIRIAQRQKGEKKFPKNYSFHFRIKFSFLIEAIVGFFLSIQFKNFRTINT